MSSDITVRFFSVLKERTGIGLYRLPVEGAKTVADVERLVVNTFPTIGPFASTWRCAVNQEYADSSAEVRPGDEVALITPVSGG